MKSDPNVPSQNQSLERVDWFLGDGLHEWVCGFFHFFWHFAGDWSPWVLIILNWHTIELETYVPHQNLCLTSWMFIKSLMKHFESPSSKFGQLCTKFIAGVLLEFFGYHKCCRAIPTQHCKTIHNKWTWHNK